MDDQLFYSKLGDILAISTDQVESELGCWINKENARKSRDCLAAKIRISIAGLGIFQGDD